MKVVVTPGEYRVTVDGSIEGYSLSGRWHVVSLSEHYDEIDVTEFGSPMKQVGLRHEVELVLRGQMPSDGAKIAERNLAYGLLREKNEDAKRALAALWQIERELPPEKEALIEVSAKDGVPTFEVKVRDRD